MGLEDFSKTKFDKFYLLSIDLKIRGLRKISKNIKYLLQASLGSVEKCKVNDAA